jgi:hypothetical protein
VLHRSRLSETEHHGVTFRSSMVPLSTFTLFFSELKTEPWAALGAGSSFRFEMPTTPCVFPVMGGRALPCWESLVL